MRYTFKLALSAAFMLPFSMVMPAFAQDAPGGEAVVDIEMTAALPGAVSIDGPPPPGEDLLIGFGGGEMGPPPAGAMAGRMCPMGGGGCMSSLSKGEHALTDEQYEKLYSLKNAMMDKMGPKMVEMFSLERQLRDVLTSADIDSKKANELKNKIAALKTDMSTIGLENRIAFMETLTADQRKDLRQAMIKGSMRGMGGPGGPGFHHMGGKGKMMMKHHRSEGPR